MTVNFNNFSYYFPQRDVKLNQIKYEAAAFRLGTDLRGFCGVLSTMGSMPLKISNGVMEKLLRSL